MTHELHLHLFKKIFNVSFWYVGIWYLDLKRALFGGSRQFWFLFDFYTITYHDQLQLSWFCFFFNDALLLQFFNSSLRATVQLSVLVHAVQDLDRPVCARSASTSLHSFRSFSSVSGLGQFDASCAIMFTELVTTLASCIYPNCLYRSGLT